MQQLVGEQGVAADAVGQVVVQALGGGELLDAGHVGAHRLDAAAVLGGQRGQRRVRLALGDARVELEGAPDDLDLVAVRELLEGASPAGACRCSTTDTRRRTRPLPACPAQPRCAFKHSGGSARRSGRCASARARPSPAVGSRNTYRTPSCRATSRFSTSSAIRSMSATVSVSSKSTLAATRIFPGPMTEVSSNGTPSTCVHGGDLRLELLLDPRRRRLPDQQRLVGPRERRRRRRAAAGRSRSRRRRPTAGRRSSAPGTGRAPRAPGRPAPRLSSNVTALTVVSVVRFR